MRLELRCKLIVYSNDGRHEFQKHSVSKNKHIIYFREEKGKEGIERVSLGYERRE
jgi:hypothetical protein